MLSLPTASSSCVSWSCNFGVDDIPSLDVGTLKIDSSNNYVVTPAGAGDAIELTSGLTGGLSFSTGAAPVSNRLLTEMVVPLTLGAGKTWTVSAAPGTPTQLALGAVTGEQYPLTIKMAGGATLRAAELDTNLLTLSGGGNVVIAAQMAQPADGVSADHRHRRRSRADQGARRSHARRARRHGDPGQRAGVRWLQHELRGAHLRDPRPGLERGQSVVSASRRITLR